MKVVVVGGVAAGPKTASRIVRLRPDAEVVMFEKGNSLSFAGCGLPYFVGGVVKQHTDLMMTPAGAVRNAGFFEKVKGVKVRPRCEVTTIDRAKRQVAYTELESGVTGVESYDKLVLATGGRPVRPPIPGINLTNIFTLHTIDDSRAVKAALVKTAARNVVIVGGGLIGVETAEALLGKVDQLTIVEMMPQILTMLDWEMALLAQRHMEANGVDVRLNCRVEGFIAGADGQSVAAVRTPQGELPADFVVLAVGVRPNAELAKAAGLAVGALGGIATDAHMRTNDPDIYAVGDCVESRHRITGQPCYVPLGSTANKHGRVAANNICGVADTFPGVLGSTVCKIFDFNIARTGLSTEAARAAGFDVVTCIAPGPDRPHYMPTFKSLIIKLIADRKTGRLLGAQAVGPGGADKRIDVAVTALSAGMTVDDISKLDLVYAPPYAPAMDNLITAADIIKNKIAGLAEGLTPEEVKQRMDAGANFVLLDVRTPPEVATAALPGAMQIPLGVLRERLAEVPRDKEVVCFCQVSLRGYEAARMLKNAGHPNVKILDGGIAAWPYEKA